jgi:hypothetical protein
MFFFNTDINECELESCFSEFDADGNVCHGFGVCKNTIGSFKCECLAGFEYDETTKKCIGLLNYFYYKIKKMSNLNILFSRRGRMYSVWRT